MENSAMPVGLLGVGEQSRKMLELFFKLYGKGQFQLAADGLPPQIGIIDLDAPSAATLLQNLRAKQGALPIIALTLKEVQHPEVDFELLKPVKPPLLLDALNTIRKRLLQAAVKEPEPVLRAIAPVSSATFGIPATPLPNDRTGFTQASPPDSLPSRETTNATAIPGGESPELVERIGGMFNARSTRTATASLDEDLGAEKFCLTGVTDTGGDPGSAVPSRIPRHTMLNLCNEALAAALGEGVPQCLVIDGLVDPIIFMPEDRGYVVTRLGKNRLRFICLAPMKEIVHMRIPLRGLPPDLVDCPPVPSSQFLWEVALLTSRGRLPEGTSLEMPIRLKRWPNLTRYLESPHAMRIAALWSRTAHSLSETVRQLSIPAGCVYSFYYAALSLNYVEELTAADVPARSPTVKDVAPAQDSPASPPAKGLLGRLLRRLLP